MGLMDNLQYQGIVFAGFLCAGVLIWFIALANGYFLNAYSLFFWIIVLYVFFRMRKRIPRLFSKKKHIQTSKFGGNRRPRRRHSRRRHSSHRRSRRR